MGVDRKKGYRIYKPFKTKEGKYIGAASNIQCKVIIDNDADVWDRRKVNCFWVGTQQIGEDDNGNSMFAWQDPLKTVNFKIDTIDAAEILAVLRGKKLVSGQSGGKFEGIFHENDKGNSNLLLKWEADKSVFSLRLSAKRKDAKEAVVISHKISIAEAIQLEIILEEFLKLHYAWN